MTKQSATGLKYSKTINQVSLWQFKKVVETNDVRFLLNLESYDDLPVIDLGEISIAWHGIYAEFSEIVGGNRADLWLVKRKRLIKMQLDFQIGTTILRAVQICPVKETVQAAAEFGYIIDLDNLKSTFEKAYTKLMRLKNKISVIENESKEEPEENEDLESLIATLEKFQGYGFDEMKMNMRKFANIYKNFKDAREQDK